MPTSSPIVRTTPSLALIMVFIFGLTMIAQAQPLTGVWRGKIRKNNVGGGTEQVELKLVRDGDSLFGAAYYYRDPSRYNLVPVKGYVDPYTGTVTFWETTKDGMAKASLPIFELDYNCPGEGVLLLDGQGGPASDPDKKNLTAHFQKEKDPIFEDDWDLAISDPGLHDNGGESPGEIFRRLYSGDRPRTIAPATPEPVARTEQKTETPKPRVHKEPTPMATPPPVVKNIPAPVKPATPEEMFTSRSRRLVTEIPLAGDTIELAFYDNAEIDGDSISLFMNGKLMYDHILLKASAFTVKIPVSALAETNEMVMVAENQGSIPPNTSLMVTYIEGKRYEATLESTEGTSAMIRFYKPSGAGPVKPRG